MGLSFLTPLAALIALACALPLAVFVRSVRRAERARRELGLPPRTRPSLPAAALVVVAVLLGLAASQPVFERTTRLDVRADAEVYVVLDVSRSMLARQGTAGTMRIDRAKRVANAIREELAGYRVGIASLTDRVLPHLFPSPNEDTFGATLRAAVGIERPPPQGLLSANATTLEALKVIPHRRFFSLDAKRRLLVVLTDGESRSVNEPAVAGSLRRAPRIATLFVHFWDPDERVFSGGVPEAEYRPDRNSRAILDRLAEATGGFVYDEGDVSAAAARSRTLLGEGPTVAQESRRRRWALAPFFAAVAFLPLGLALTRRER